MRIEKIGNDKIKVTLTTTDLMNFDVSISDLSPDSEELHTFLFRVMETIREETGFNPFGGQVVVEATPLRDGICIVVSKTKALPQLRSLGGMKRNVRVKAKAKSPALPQVYYFISFDDMCAALVQLETGELEQMKLYEINGVYCVLIKTGGEGNRMLSVLSEFCMKRSYFPLQQRHVEEHGKLIAEGMGLVNMAENLKSLT